MGAWNNFYLQRMGADNGSPYSVCESVQEWGIWCKSIPFILAGKVKEPASHSWNDEDGDDEYIPAEGLKFEAYTMDVEFGCKKLTSAEASKYGGDAISDVRQKVGAFMEYLRTSGMMKLYSSHTRIGRQNVRLVQFHDNAKWYKDESGFEFLVFKVTFKVNDPVTNVVLPSNVQNG